MERWAALLAAIAGGAVALAIYVNAPAETQAALSVEFAKAAIGLIPLAVFGGIIASIVRARDERKTESHRLDTYRREFYDELIGAYNAVKITRRRLRGAGLADPWSGRLDEVRLNLLDSEIGDLIKTQLTFEKLWREMEAPGASFRDEARIQDNLLKIEQRLNQVVKDWERGRASLVVDGPAVQLGEWDHYRWFTNNDPECVERPHGEPEKHFDEVVAAMHDIEGLVNEQLNESRGRKAAPTPATAAERNPR